MQNLPRWERALLAKHNAQMAEHQAKFGTLGSLQTKQQKAALKSANSKLKVAS